MTYRQLVEAWKEAIDGVRYPLLMALADEHIESIAELFREDFKARPDASTSTAKYHLFIHRLYNHKMANFAGVVMVFRPGVPADEIWFWFGDAECKEIKIK